METESTADGVQEPTPSIQRWGWLFAAPWLVFLVIQVFVLIDSGRPNWQVGLAIGLMAVFSVCFLLPFVRYSSAVLSGRTAETMAWAPLAGMLVIVALSIPLMSWSATAYFPYLVAYLAFHIPVRIALPASVALLLTMVLTLWIGGVLRELVYLVLVTGLTTVANFTSVVLIQRAGREEELLAEQRRLRERERLGRDLHDLLGHSLTVIAVKAELAEALAERSPAAARAEIVQIREVTRDALNRVRFTVGQMRNSTVSEEIAGLEISFAGTGTALEVAGTPGKLAPGLEQVLGWILREAATNVLRHARAEHCRIVWGEHTVRITDDGVGVPQQQADAVASSGNGVRNMDSRAREVGADFTIGPAPDGPGTTVEVSW